MLTELEKKIIATIQGDIATTKRPFQQIAKRLNISEETLLEKLKALSHRGVIRRFGATLRHQKSGFEANAMIAWKVDEKQIDEVGKKMGVTRERIRQIEAQALRRLRNPRIQEKLQAYLD